MSDKQCPRCLRRHVGPIRTWRLSTMYVDHLLNYAQCCYHCICEVDEGYFWDWHEYYSSQGYGQMFPIFEPRGKSDFHTGVKI